MVEFCQAMSCNETIEKVDLRNQISPILTTADDIVIECMQKNRTVQNFQVDVKSVHVKEAITSQLARNQKSPNSDEKDTKILEALEAEATRSEELHEQQRLASKALEVSSTDDWDYLYELSQRANKYQLATASHENEDIKMNLNVSTHHEPESAMAMRRKRAQEMLGPTVNMTSDGAFLTDDFVSAYLVESAESGSLTFAFQAQSKIFKRFPIGDTKRQFISEKFADSLLQHPRANEITHINMANCACGDEWLARLCTRCLEDATLLPMLHSLNLETNYISTAGVIALSSCLSSPNTWRYLQAVKLENQRHLISSRAELELAKALCKNKSVIRFSLRVRNLWERDQINKFVSRNMDFLRQARLYHAKKTGALVERSRNSMEQLFDRVAANDPTLTDLEVVGNQVFLSLPRDEVVKAAEAFATNSHIKSVRMTMLRLDDVFASSLARSLEASTTIEKLILESNAIGSAGILALVRCLGRNKSVVELQSRHQ
jgi:Leucine Rich repeat